jgi:uncharacterized damage-inducible protein DinB
MRHVRLFAAVMTLLLPIAATAQTPAPAAAPGQPLTAAAKAQHDMVKGNIVKAAEKMAEADYSFKPTPEVRSFGAIVGHVANANYMICSRAAGDKSPMADDIEKTKTTKADLVKAVADSFAYCDAVFAKMTDTAGAEAVDFFRGKQPKLGVLNFNSMHNWEHYGNLVTYMRLKGVVPPSSEGR